jgi:zona occludens toxin (predicted ATPase)
VAGIHAFCGLPGSGKTYSAVRAVYRVRARDHKRVIWSNTPLYLPWGEPVQFFDEVDDLFSVPRGSVVLLDEAHLWLSSRNWKAINGKVNEWFSQLRKRHVDLLITAQNVTAVDKSLRDKIAFCSFMESFKRLGGFFYYETYMSINRRKQDLYAKGWYWFSRKVSQVYDTEYIVKV